MELPVVLFILFTIGMIVFAIFAYKKEQERIAALAAHALARGADFHHHAASLDDGLFSRSQGIPVLMDAVAMFGGTEPFGRGHTRRAVNLMVFPEGERSQLLAFDYSYKITTSNGKSTQTTTYPFRLLILRVGLALPVLSLEPEHLGHRIAEKFGMSEIEFELDEFNRKYFVRGQDREGIFAVLDPQMLEHLLSIHPIKLECAGPAIMLIEPGKMTVADLQRMETNIQSICGHIPEYLWKDLALGRRPGSGTY